MKDRFCGVLPFHRLRLGGNLTHIPKDSTQALYPVWGQRGYIHTIVPSGGLDSKDGHHLFPGWGLPLYVNAVIVSRLQCFQLVRKFNIELRNRCI